MGWEDDNRRQQDEQRKKAQDEDRRRAESRRAQQLRDQRESDRAKIVAAALAKKRKEEAQELLEKRKELSAEYDQSILADANSDESYSPSAPALNRGLSSGLGGFAPPRLSANARSKPAGPFQNENEDSEASATLGTAPKQASLPPLRRYGI